MSFKYILLGTQLVRAPAAATTPVPASADYEREQDGTRRNAADDADLNVGGLGYFKQPPGGWSDA